MAKYKTILIERLEKAVAERAEIEMMYANKFMNKDAYEHFKLKHDTRIETLQWAIALKMAEETGLLNEEA